MPRKKITEGEEAATTPKRPRAKPRTRTKPKVARKKADPPMLAGELAAIPANEIPTERESDLFALLTECDFHRVRRFNAERWGVYVMTEEGVCLGAVGLTRSDAIAKATRKFEVPEP